MATLDAQEFDYQARRYVKRLMYKGLDVATFKRYVREDLKDEEQAQELIEDVLHKYNAALDVLLQEVLDVLDYKEKFAIVGNDIITTYPHPIVENRNVVGVEYKPHKNYTFTDDELFNRYIKLLDDKEKTEQAIKAYRRKQIKTIKNYREKRAKAIAERAEAERIKPLKEKQKKEKRAKLNFIVNNIAMISERNRAGLSYKKLAEEYGVSDQTISKHVRNYRKEQAAATL